LFNQYPRTLQNLLGVNPHEVFGVLAGILHLGNIKFEELSNGEYLFYVIYLDFH